MEGGGNKKSSSNGGRGDRRRHAEVLRNYYLGSTLGVGRFAKVKLAEHKLTGCKVAIKIINCKNMTNVQIEEKVKREIEILKGFDHPHIVQLYESIYTPTDIYAVMEYCEYGELYDFIVQKERVPEAEARRLFQQIISAVEYCHTNKVAHRDLKPENLLLDSKCNVKLADFGLSNVMRDGCLLKTSCGSPHYAAPEIVSGKQYAGPEVDVWSCGVILYALLCGTLPFDDVNMINLFKKIKDGVYTLPQQLSPLAKDLIPRMLVVDPTKRITIPEIREHLWFKINLPPYLAVTPPIASQEANKQIDEQTLRVVVNLGFTKDHVYESLCSRLQNEATVAYYLLLDNLLPATGGYHGVHDQGSMDISSTGHYLPGSRAVRSNGWGPLYPAGTKWALGLQSRAHFDEVMSDVQQALQMLHVSWARHGTTKLKCSLPSDVQDMLDDSNDNLLADDSTIMDTGADHLGFEMQLHKIRNNKFRVDLQMLTGGQIRFVDFCDSFLTMLRVL